MARLDEAAHDAADIHPDGPASFLANVYSMAIKNQSDTYDDPEAVAEWVARLDEAAHDAADIHPNRPAVFLANVYSVAITNLADTYPDPTTDRVQAWLAELTDRATTAAQSDDHNLHPGQFLANVYSIVFKNLADTYPDPTTDRVQAWLVELTDRLPRVAEETDTLS